MSVEMRTWFEVYECVARVSNQPDQTAQLGFNSVAFFRARRSAYNFGRRHGLRYVKQIDFGRSSDLNAVGSFTVIPHLVAVRPEREGVGWVLGLDTFVQLRR